ncbi:hypothetical protein QJQ45_011365 [Haematococcus lacustris]|nr:hypothetical protein QJQ45_011365 [Haematococcus lacustris]
MSQLHSRHKCQVDGEQQPANKRSHDTQFGPLPREDKGAPVSADMQRAVRRRIGLFLVTQQVPFMTVDNIHLQAAFQIVADTRTDEDGKTTTACISVRRGLWTFQGARHFPNLRQAAIRLLSMHVTTAAAERNWSSWGNTYKSQLNVATAEKMVYIKANIPSSEPSEPSQLLAEGITTHTTEEQDEQTMPPSMPKQQQDWATARPSITKPFVAMPMFDQKRDDKHWDDECLTLLCSFAPDSVKQLCTLGKKLSVKMLNEYCKAVGLYVPANTLRADLRYMVLEHLNGQAERD